MLFAFTGTDKPDQLDLRVATRPDHVAYLTGLNDTGVLKLAGPFIDGNGTPCGSMLVLEADTIEAARDILAGDPYAKVGLFAATEVRAWNWTFGKPAGN